MARMLGIATANTVSCCRRHSPPTVQRNGTARAREKRSAAAWLDEYEERTPLDCPLNDYRLQGSDDLLVAVRCLC